MLIDSVFYRALSYDTFLTKYTVICQLSNREKCLHKLLPVTSFLRSETEQCPGKKTVNAQKQHN